MTTKQSSEEDERQYENIALDTDIQLVSEPIVASGYMYHLLDGRSPADEDLRWMQEGKTIFSRSAESQLEHFDTGKKILETMEESAAGFQIQMAIFFCMVVLLGLTPVIKQNALWDEELGMKVANFVPQTPYVVHFSLSVLLANSISFAAFGLPGLKNCWDTKAMWLILPVSTIYAVAEQMEMFTLQHIDGVLWKILNQLKLPLTALIGAFFLRRKQSFVQWMLIISVSISILTYCSVSQGSIGADSLSWGIALAVFNVALATSAGLLADTMYKRVKHNFVAQMAQGRLIATGMVSLVMIYTVAKDDTFWKLPFYGWNFRVFVLALWLLVKDWSVAFVLKNLDSMWKALGTALGLVVTYFAEILVMGKAVDITQFLVVLTVFINIVIYASTKIRYSKKIEEERNA